MSLTGRTVGHHFRVGKFLGRGTFGEVYAAFNTALEKDFALKALRADRRLSTRVRARFLREARILSQLEHPNICRIYDYHEEDDADFLVLELIDGRSLQDAIAEGLDTATKLRIAEQIAGVLVVAHGESVVHRDLKPGNVMLTPYGQVKVLDFGLASAQQSMQSAEPAHQETVLQRMPAHPGETTLEEESGDVVPGSTVDRLEVMDGLRTVAGSVLGTLPFMSPEQARGESATSASDMFSFGMLLQNLFTGLVPRDENPDRDALLERAGRGETRPVQGVDAELTRLIERLKSHAPGHRPTAIETRSRLRRIRERPRRRLRRLAVAAVLLLAALFGAKYVIDLSRARSLAEQRRAQAETLIDFMLGDLRTKLKPLGQLVILDDVGDMALEYFKSVDERQLSDDELLLYSRALGQIGEVRMDQGDLEAASDSFRQSLPMAQVLAERDPDNGSWQNGLGAAHYYVGWAAMKRSAVDEALEHFRAYKRISESLVAREPDSEEWQQELAYGHTNVGLILEEKGDLDGALAEYRAGMEIKRSLVARDPDNATRNHSLAVTHQNIGGLLAALGRSDEAEEHYRQSLAIERALVERDPDNRDRLNQLAVALNLLGNFLDEREDVDGALELYREDLAITRRLAEEDPTNLSWQREMAVSHGRIGALLSRTDPVAGLQQLETQRDILQRVVAQSPTNAVWHLDLSVADLQIALAAEGAGDFERARRSTTTTLDRLENYHREHPDDRGARRWLGMAYLLHGRLLERQSLADRARDAWTRALATVEPVATDSEDAAYLNVLARALLRLDRLSDAEPIIRKLEARDQRDAGLTELCSEKEIPT